MRRRVIVLALTTVLALGVSASAFEAVGSSFGTLTTAQVLGQGKGTFGFGVGLADRTSFVGTFAYGLSQYSDGRLKLGLTDPDNGDTKVTFGADYKWQFWNYGSSSNHPFDGAMGVFLEYADFGGRSTSHYGLSALQFGWHVIGSYPIKLKRGGTLSPYARFNARVEWLSGDDSESNLEVGLNGGVQWQMTPTMAGYAEFQVDGNDGIFLGIDLGVM